MNKNRRCPIILAAGMFLIQALLVVPSLSSHEASATPPTPTAWTRYAGNPLVTPNPSGWDSGSIYGTSLVDTGDEFFFYYVSTGGIGLAISPDCKSWTKYGTGPMFTSNCNPSILKDGATFKLWYMDSSGVCYATSSDGKSWTTMATGLMKLGSAGAWDSQIWRIVVLKDTDGYKMYYEGRYTNSQIGYASSPDETHWTKYPGNPILTWGPSGSFDSQNVQFPWVMKMSGEYRMWYTGHDGARVAIGYANSTDGISWTKYASNPVLGYNNGWDYSCTMPTVVLRNNTLEMMYTGITSSWTYEAGLAESFGTTPAAPTLLSPLNDQWTNDSTPRFGWRFGTPSEQTSFQLQLDTDPGFSPPVYDSGKLGANTTGLTIPSPLADGIYYWRVKAWDLIDVPSGWSPAWKVKLDSTPPQNPANLSSASHSAGVWSNDNTVEADWSMPPGGGDISGYAGFGAVWDTSPSTVPDALNILDPAAVSSTSPPASETASLYFHIRAKDRAGNWAVGAAHLGPFMVDSTPPLNPNDVHSTSHVPQQWSADNTIDMTWSEPAAGVSGAEGYSYVWDLSSYTLPQMVLNISADVQNISSEPLSDGNGWYFHLRTKDQAGNWALNGAHSGPYWIDSTPPTVLDLTLNGGSAFATCETARAIVRAEDAPGGSGLSKMRWKLNDDDWGSWVNYEDSNVIALYKGDGEYSIQVEVRDLANNTSPAANATILLDRALPPVADLKLDGGSAFATCATVQFSIVAQDPEPASGIWNMSFSDDGKSWDNWLPFNATGQRNLPAGDGSKTVYVRLRDRAGNIGPAASAAIVLDTVLPVSFIPMFPDVIHDLVFDVCWTAADATSGVATFDVQYQDGDGSWTDWLTGTCQTFGRFTGLDGHSYRFRAEATDRAGNREASFKTASGSVSIELPPPFISIARPAANSTVTGKFTVSGTAGHPRNDRWVVLVEVRIDDGDWRPARGNLTWSFSYDSNKLKNGRHTLAVRAFDGTRYSAEQTTDIEVQNEPGLTLAGLPLLAVLVVLVLAVAAAGAIYLAGRRRSRSPGPSYDAPPAGISPPANPPPAEADGVSRISPNSIPPGAEAPGVRAKFVTPPAMPTIPEPETEPAAPGLPAAPPKPRTPDEEQAMRESKVLKALSSLPRGLPSSLWGIELEDLAAKVVKGERTINPDGDLLVKLNNRWYYGDETDLGLFMQQYKER